MAHGAQRNQVRVIVVTLSTAHLPMVDLQVLSAATDLALPAIAAQDLLPELVVWFSIKSQTWPLSNPASRGLLGHFVQKSLSLFAGQKFKEP